MLPIPRSNSNKGAPDFELVPKEIKPNMKVLGKTYRNRAKSIAEALVNADMNLAGSGSITLQVDGEEITLDASCFTLEKERLLKGKAVDVLEVGTSTIVIMRNIIRKVYSQQMPYYTRVKI